MNSDLVQPVPELVPEPELVLVLPAAVLPGSEQPVLVLERQVRIWSSRCRIWRCLCSAVTNFAFLKRTATLCTKVSHINISSNF